MEWIRKLLGRDAPGGAGDPAGNGVGGGSAVAMISCMEAVERLYEYLDDELVGLEHEQVAEHFRVCQNCYPHVNFERAFLTAVNRSQTDDSAPEDLKSRIIEALREEGLETG